MADLTHAPPPGSNSFNFMQFLGQFEEIVCWRPLEGWHPHLGEILYPPLPVADPGFPWSCQPIIWPMFPKNCMDMKENRPRK